ncbi:MAG: beta-N-acetylhexosaminidase [bacterium]
MQRKLYLFFVLTLILCTCKEEEKQQSEILIIPQPQEVILNQGFFTLNNDVKLVGDAFFPVTSEFFKVMIRDGTAQLEFTDEGQKKIIFSKDESIIQEGYELKIEPSEIQIKAASDQGAFYAIQSLRQLIPETVEDGSLRNEEIKIPCIEIKDQPRFSYRGMHLDVGRHMFSVDFIKKYIDALAMLKMNKFHWHLTEDQGWRIEIKKYPKLQEIAAYRDETLIGHYNDQPHQFDGERYGGYYTQEEVKDIVGYAQARFVTVIPEIEMPGHSQAAIAAYPELGCTGNQILVAKKWGVFEDIYCPTETTFKFLEDVLDEVMILFPSKYIHIGGDEAPKSQWKESALAQAIIKEQGLEDEHELQSYFIKRIEKYLNSKGRQIIGWDEILEGGLAPNATVMSWRGTEGAIAAAKQQHDVVMTPTSHCYFDYYQSENDDEPLAIGGYISLEKVYHFNPIPDELNEEDATYVKGAQGNMWTEYIKTEELLEYMLFPRLLAMSEVVWTNSDQKNYKDFINRVEHFHSRLEALNMNYANHLYEVEGQIISSNGNTTYKLNTLTDDKQIAYTIDGSEPNLFSAIYEEAIPISESTMIKARVSNGNELLGTTFSEEINLHKAIGAKITIDKKPHPAYQGSGAEGLINGISGSDTRYGDKEWLGFWGEDIELTIEFDEVKHLHSLQTRFHNGNGQWIYAPKNILISIYDDVYDSFELNSEGLIVDLKINFTGKKGKILKIKIPNYGIIPEGKQGTGNPAWTFIDEIIIN